jgi:hypothetical protein
VACGIIGARAIDGVLSIGSLNISSPRMRQERAKLLAERARTNGKIDWLGRGDATRWSKVGCRTTKEVARN